MLDPFQESVLHSLERGQGIKVITYEYNDLTKAKIDFIIAELLKKYDRMQWQAMAYTCLKELIINASKANFKWLYFDKYNYDIENPESYHEHSLEFKAYLEENGIEEIGALAREMQRDVTITFTHDKDAIIFSVVNHTPITPEDDKRIRNRLTVGANYDNIAQFYMEQGDNLEGAGIGIALIQILLKGEGLEHKQFTIGSQEGTTTARICLPLS
jgi:hypothetical protein